MVFGRPIVILNKRACNEDDMFVHYNDIMAYGVLSLHSNNDSELRILE